MFNYFEIDIYEEVGFITDMVFAWINNIETIRFCEDIWSVSYGSLIGKCGKSF